MTLKPVLSLLISLLVLGTCGQPARRPAADCFGSLETSTKATTVRTASGSVAGYIDDGVYIYKGIPYARADRFQPAVAPEPWTEVRSSRAYGPTCPQDKRTGWYSDAQAFSMHWDDGFPDEDCLRVNVWTGGINDGGKRPVMVWLHGGGFSSGSANGASSDGASLSRFGDVVVVGSPARILRSVEGRAHDEPNLEV